MNRHLLMIAILVALFFSACSTSSIATSQPTAKPVATSTPLPMSAAARAYLESAFDFIKQYFIGTRSVDWTTLRQQTFADASDAQVPADTYDAISGLLRKLDKHSSFLTPQDAQGTFGGSAPPPTYPSGHPLANNIGYLLIPAMEGNPAQEQSYAQQAQDTIRTEDRSRRCGWIVDLRGNGGGNMWPMLAGIGPILGDGRAGAFQSLTATVWWGYHQGGAYVGSTTIVQVAHPYTVQLSDPAVAILTDHGTASSGEAITIAFRGRAHSRSFGLPTLGLATANSLHKLSDGAYINLTTANDVDRAGKVYGESPIVPDQTLSGTTSPGGDVVIQAAVTWLHQQSSCAG
jgi:carboxyl-terminal processing protease